MLGRRWLLFFAVLGSTASQKEGKKKVGKNKNNSTPPKARALNINIGTLRTLRNRINRTLCTNNNFIRALYDVSVQNLALRNLY